MVKVFGDKNVFAIRYEFVTNPFNEISLIGETWGRFELIVQGIHVCEYRRGSSITTYQWNLMYIVEWLIENLKHIVSDELFPLPVKGQNSLELLDNCLLFESDNDVELDVWFDTKQDWEFKHSWFSSRAGSFLPYVFFRRVNDKVEIAWNNESIYSSEAISFLHPSGIEYVPLDIFDSVVKNFIEDFFDNLMLITKHQRVVNEMYQKL
ncbi:DUF5984 family protein [Brevibacillus fluminis]|uniref:DUF5984 family protein n=1 Tax=Brevibacillus fluminis TaxID=511487 RepID=UPI003F8A868C